jgi:hypothetical protein
MSTTPTVITAENENLFQRIKGFCGTALFLLIQSSPKILKLYRNEKSWTLLRIALGCFGAALVILPLSLWHGWFTAVFGLLFFVVSILLPPAELESATDRKARELGAQTVISGGEFQASKTTSAPVQFFISPSQTWAMDKNYEPQVIITTAEIAKLDVIPRENHWLLIVRWGDRRAEFTYKGVFAERFARLAEESLRHASLAGQPPQAKSRAARV